MRTMEARRWMAHHWSVEGESMSTSATPDLYGYDEFVERLQRNLTPAQRLAGLAPEERLAGLAPEERLAGLAPEHVALALPTEVLRALSEDYIAALPADVQREVRARRGG